MSLDRVSSTIKEIGGQAESAVAHGLIHEGGHALDLVRPGGTAEVVAHHGAADGGVSGENSSVDGGVTGLEPGGDGPGGSAVLAEDRGGDALRDLR